MDEDAKSEIGSEDTKLKLGGAILLLSSLGGSICVGRSLISLYPRSISEGDSSAARCYAVIEHTLITVGATVQVRVVFLVHGPRQAWLTLKVGDFIGCAVLHELQPYTYGSKRRDVAVLSISEQF